MQIWLFLPLFNPFTSLEYPADKAWAPQYDIEDTS